MPFDMSGMPAWLLAAPEAMKAFVAWVEGEGTVSLPDSFDAGFPPAVACPAEWPAWAPWVATAHHASFRADFPFLVLGHAGWTREELIAAVHAAFAPLGLLPSRLPIPLAVVPMVMEMWNTTGETSDRGRLVGVIYASVGSTATAAMVLVRP